MEQSKAKMDIRELPKGVKLNSLSKYVTFIKITINITIIWTKNSLIIVEKCEIGYYPLFIYDRKNRSLVDITS